MQHIVLLPKYIKYISKRVFLLAFAFDTAGICRLKFYYDTTKLIQGGSNMTGTICV